MVLLYYNNFPLEEQRLREIRNKMDDLKKQVEVIKCIPEIAFYYWPAWFTFPAVEYLEAMLIPLVPNPGGVAGQVINAALRGATRVVQMATWDAVKSQGVGGCGIVRPAAAKPP